jgi:hypothetical protein
MDILSLFYYHAKYGYKWTPHIIIIVIITTIIYHLLFIT